MRRCALSARMGWAFVSWIVNLHKLPDFPHDSFLVRDPAFMARVVLIDSGRL